MDTATLLADPAALNLDAFVSHENSITVVVHSSQRFAVCPLCRQSSSSLHSNYVRNIADLPWHNVAVRLELHTRKFRCRNDMCQRKVFCERLPNVAQASARKTVRLNNALTWLAFALGGEDGARIARKLSLSVSGDTLLRRIRQYRFGEKPVVKVLGVDDFSFRRGVRFGTILVDLEKRQPIDLLPDRESETLKTWLAAHPEVEIISRDRGGSYADGARRGAPQAVQIADRWHLLKNSSEAFEQILAQYRQTCRTIAKKGAQLICQKISENQEALPELTSEAHPQPFTPAATRSPAELERGKQLRRELIKLHEQVQQLKCAGLNINQIRRQLGIGYQRTKQYFDSAEFHEPGKRSKGGSQVDHVADYLRQRWSEGCQNSKRLFEELRKQGCRASWTTVRRYVQGWRVRSLQLSLSPPPPDNLPKSPRQVLWLLLKNESELTGEERRFKEELFNQEPEIKRTLELMKEFREIIIRQKPAQFDQWLEKAAASEEKKLMNFAEGLRRDEQAVRAALSYEWSQGQVEGQVNRLKLIKRQMFGRAKFDLLRARVLHQF